MTNCPDIARQVFGYIDDEDLSACTQVCKSWRDALYEERFFWTRRLNYLLTRNIYPNDTCFDDECECRTCPRHDNFYYCKCTRPTTCHKLETLELSISTYDSFLNIFHKLEEVEIEGLKNVCINLIKHMRDNTDQAWFTLQGSETAIFGPLHVAVYRRDIGFLNMLLEYPQKGSNFDTRGDSSYYGYYYGSTHKGFVYQNVPSNDDARHIHPHDTPLEMAARKGDFEIVKLMLESQRIKKLSGTLIIAARRGDEDMIKLLYENGGNLNISTALTVAPNYKIVELLINFASPNKRESIIEILDDDIGDLEVELEEESHQCYYHRHPDPPTLSSAGFAAYLFSKLKNMTTPEPAKKRRKLDRK